jgi:formate dehydrogenase subunit gamma
MLGGVAISVSGLLLMMPGLLDNVITQQWAHIAHGMVSMGMIAMILGHIYIGSLGMEGAFEAMRDGEVDYNWAREHHSAWLDEELERARHAIAPDVNGPRRVAGAD